MRNPITRSLVFTLMCCEFITQPVQGQANCALRNPDRQIFEIFPEAKSYRTVEARIDGAIQADIEEILGSRLANTDQGTHTAYIVLDGTVPIGFVHARTEIGPRGSIELVWAMDLDLAIIDFRVQRSRERHTDVIEDETFRLKLVGRNISELRELLTAGNDAIDLAALEVSPEASSIAYCAVLCALKTRVITDFAFKDSIIAARTLGYIHREFDDPIRIARINLQTSDPVYQKTQLRLGQIPDQVSVDTMDVMRVIGSEKQSLGVFFSLTWEDHPDRPRVWCSTTADGSLKNIWIDGSLKSRFESQIQGFRGQGLEAIEDAPPQENGGSVSRLIREMLAISSSILVE